MSFIPSGLSRVPNLLWGRLAIHNINRTSVELFKTQQELSTGKAISRPSDDPVKAATIGVLDERLRRADQVKRNLQHAESNLGVLDNTLAEATTVAQEAKSIASQQLSITSSPAERRSQSIIVDQLIQSLFNTASRTGPAGYLFGGSITSIPPIVVHNGGYKYVGGGPGLITDIPIAGNVPITLAASNVIGALSSRVKGTVDLNPTLLSSARLADVGGARGLGITPGVVEFSFAGGPRTQIDLNGADSVNDVITRVTNALHQYETDHSVTILASGGVSVSAGGLSIDVATATPTNPTLQFFDLANGTAAKDLGLTSDTAPFSFSAGSHNGLDLAPKLTWTTPVSTLSGVTGGLGTIRLNNLGRTALVDLSRANTVEDIKSLVEGANLGARVVINAAGTGIDIVNEMASSREGALSIEEVAGNNLTATRLGLRSLAPNTALADFNDGRGVKINDGTLNPTTGLPDPSLDVDFRITLGNAAQTTLDIDLRPQDMANVQTLLDRINTQAQPQLAAAGLPPTAFNAGLLDGQNGIAFHQDAAFGVALRVDARNNSPAAENLGLLNGTWDAPGATLIAQDRAKVRVDNLFTHLIDLRDSLYANDTRAITQAGEDVEKALSTMAETRGLVGGYAQRIQSAQSREQDRDVVDETIRSDLQDADFSAAASKLALLQTQMQSTLQVAAQSQQRTLLDFLG